RRRHTRFSRDGSSDVCSSDLYLPSNAVRIPERVGVSWWFDQDAARRRDPAERHGPYVVELRGRLGARSLAAAASGARRFMLEIEIGRASCREGAGGPGGAVSL